MDNQMNEAEEALTPLSEIFMENAELVAGLEQLSAKFEAIYPDCGDELDAICALRDTTIYLALKMREDRLNNPNHCAAEPRASRRRPAADARASGKRSRRKKAAQVKILRLSADNIKRLKCPPGANHSRAGVAGFESLVGWERINSLMNATASKTSGRIKHIAEYRQEFTK